MRIKYNLKAFRELRTGPKAEALVEGIATGYAQACGEGYEALPAQPARNRAHRVVAPVTYEAILDNNANQTLLKNLPRR